MKNTCAVLLDLFAQKGFKGQRLREGFVHIDWRMPEDPDVLKFYIRCSGGRILLFWMVPLQHFFAKGNSQEDLAYALSDISVRYRNDNIKMDLKEGELLVSRCFKRPILLFSAESIYNRAYNSMLDTHVRYQDIMHSLDQLRNRQTPPKEEESKQSDSKESPIRIVDITDQLPEGYGIMILGGDPEGEKGSSSK